MITQSVQSLTESELASKATAARFVEAFNSDDWDIVRDVVADDFVFHHPIGGTVEAGPEGMVAAWAGFKRLSPDSWHPIPILIAEGDYAAVLLPTYGHFTGRSDQAPPPTGGRLDYGMVNMVRFDAGKLAEMWFGMDSLVELQRMGVAPVSPSRLRRPRSRRPRGIPGCQRARAHRLRQRDSVRRHHHCLLATPVEPHVRDAAGRDPPLRGSRTHPGLPPRAHDPTAVRRGPSVDHGDESRGRGPLVRCGPARSRTDRARRGRLPEHPRPPDRDALRGRPLRQHGVGGGSASSGSPSRTSRSSTTSGRGGDIVAARWHARGTSGRILGLAPTGRTLTTPASPCIASRTAGSPRSGRRGTRSAILHQLDPRIGGGHHH